MSFEKLAEDAGRKFGKTDAAAFLRKVSVVGPSSESVLARGVAIFLIVASLASVGMFLWMFRYQVGGDGLILDRLKQTTYRCYSNDKFPVCTQVFPPRPGYVRDL